jgi:Acyl-CoA dehydrogenase, C-terminal domain
MDPDSAELLRHSLRRALAASDVDAALVEVGWRDALREAGIAVVPLLFAEQGAANVTSAALDDLLLSEQAEFIPDGAAIVLPAFATHVPPGRRVGEVLAIGGLGTARVLTAGEAVVVTPDGNGYRAMVVPTAGLCARPVGGLDPGSGLVQIEGECRTWTEAGRVDWTRLAAAGQLALAYELIGVGRAMLGLAREHALARVQFGQPISRFQAVRHRLADALVAIEAANDAATAALESTGPGTRVSPLLAGIAKAVAGRGAQTVARHCQQVLAGVGFTTEHAFHRYFRRAHTLDGLFGDARTLTRELGEELLRTRRIPAAPPL